MNVNVHSSLTPKQKQVLDFINKFTAKNGYSPSLQEIATHLQKSIGTVQHFIEELQGKGYLLRKENVARGITATETDKQQIFKLGYIAAGNPIEPIENPEPIDVPASFLKSPGNYYALEVRGDSMIDMGILDKDIVLIRHQIRADIGDVVVGITENGATLKILGRKNGKTILEPRNPKYDIIIPEQLEVRGVFVGLIRPE